MSLLNADQIAARKDEIFVGGTFSKECLRSAAYDLRIRPKKLDTIGELHDTRLTLETGQHAVLQSYERIAMPWDLAGNLGAKYRMAMQGLFVVPGLFVDPGFGWVWDEDDERLKPAGRRLRFVVTNMGRKSITLQLGTGTQDDRPDHVLSIQFIELEPAKKQLPVSDVPVDAQSVAFFEDVTEMQREFRAVAATANETASSTWHVVVFGVFLLATALFGALLVEFLTLVGSGETTRKLVDGANDLDLSRPGPLIVLIVLAALALASAAYVGLRAVAIYRRLFGSRPQATRPKQ